MNTDALANFDIIRASRSAFALADRLQERDRSTQLPAAMLFVYAIIQATGLSPAQLLGYAENAAGDARDRQQPEVGALIRYVREELVKGAP